jgi:hypothetical protein
MNLSDPRLTFYIVIDSYIEFRFDLVIGVILGFPNMNFRYALSPITPVVPTIAYAHYFIVDIRLHHLRQTGRTTLV